MHHSRVEKSLWRTQKRTKLPSAVFTLTSIGVEWKGPWSWNECLFLLTLFSCTVHWSNVLVFEGLSKDCQELGIVLVLAAMLVWYSKLWCCLRLCCVVCKVLWGGGAESIIENGEARQFPHFANSENSSLSFAFGGALSVVFHAPALHCHYTNNCCVMLKIRKCDNIAVSFLYCSILVCYYSFHPTLCHDTTSVYYMKLCFCKSEIAFLRYLLFFSHFCRKSKRTHQNLIETTRSRLKPWNWSRRWRRQSMRLSVPRRTVLKSSLSRSSFRVSKADGLVRVGQSGSRYLCLSAESVAVNCLSFWKESTRVRTVP